MVNGKKKEIDAAEYIRASFQPSDRLAVLVRNCKRGETMQRITSSARIIEPSFQGWLRAKNEKEFCDIYIGMNTLKPGAHTRTKEDIDAIRHLYADLDRDGQASLVAVQQSNLAPAPNYVLCTSPGKFQVVWKAEGMAPGEAEALLRAIARRFGGDPAATDSTRVLRLPGFVNRKYDAEYIVKADQYSDRTYHSVDFNLGVESDPGYQPLRGARAKSVSSGERLLSQSERDWAYAQRSLARGADPKEVIRTIADLRARDKHNPQDYARRTVLKAQAELNAGGKRSDAAPADSAEPDYGHG